MCSRLASAVALASGRPLLEEGLATDPTSSSDEATAVPSSAVSSAWATSSDSDCPAPGTALICHLSLTDLVEGLRREVAVERVELVGLQSVGLHL